MKVSIVIPAHNEERYIAGTLRAVKAIRYPDLEIIIVDNASTDRTLEIANSFPGVKVVEEKRKGTQFARERGRQESKGEIVANCDADCLPDEDWVQKGIDILREKNAVAVSGPYDFYDSRPLARFTMLYVQKIYFLVNLILRWTGKGGISIGGNFIARADALQKIGGYNTELTFWGDDTDTAKRLSKVGKMAFDTRLVVKSSARRFKNQGLFRTLFLYLYHFFRIIFRKEKNEIQN